VVAQDLDKSPIRGHEFASLALGAGDVDAIVNGVIRLSGYPEGILYQRCREHNGSKKIWQKATGNLGLFRR
jgi:hypothetical protein